MVPGELLHAPIASGLEKWRRLRLDKTSPSNHARCQMAMEKKSFTSYCGRLPNVLQLEPPFYPHHSQTPRCPLTMPLSAHPNSQHQIGTVSQGMVPFPTQPASLTTPHLLLRGTERPSSPFAIHHHSGPLATNGSPAVRCCIHGETSGGWVWASAGASWEAALQGKGTREL